MNQSNETVTSPQPPETLPEDRVISPERFLDERVEPRESLEKRHRYQLMRVILKTTSGTIYQGEDLITKTKVAIKSIHDTTPEAIDQLHKEAVAQASLTHPNLLQTYDFIQLDDPHDPDHPDADDSAFIVMEYLDPKEWMSLLEVIEWHTTHQALIPLPNVMTILDQYAEAISYLQKKGIRHGDLKPDNVMVRFQLKREDALIRPTFDFPHDGHGEAKAKLIDFGLSNKVIPATDDIIRGANIYFSPEALNSKPQTPRTDVYVTALIVYELFTGQHFFEYHSPGDADGLRALFQSRKEMVSPEKNVTLVKSLITYGIPHEKQLLFLKMMTQALDPNPEKRYEDVPAFIKALHSILDLGPQETELNKRN